MRQFMLVPRARRLRRLGDLLPILPRMLAVAFLLAYAAAWGTKAWNLRGWRERFSGERTQAEELGLTYEAVKLAPIQFRGRLVLWNLGRTLTDRPLSRGPSRWAPGGSDSDWHYMGDKDRPVRFVNPPDLPWSGRKGLEVRRVLARIHDAGPSGVALEFLRDYGTL